jgi:hypothetical protein
VVVRAHPLSFKSQLNLVINSLYLPLRFAGAENKIIGKTAYLTGIQQYDIVGLFFTGGGYRLTGYIDGFQLIHSAFFFYSIITQPETRGATRLLVSLWF